jgi:circadian clock protein KaiC
MMLDDQYTVFHPSEMELGETTKAVCDLVERVKPARVVFDSLSELRLLAREPLRYRRQIHALKQHFAARKCTVLLLDDRMTAKRDLRLESVASGVLRLEQLAPEYGAERRRLRVIKLRGVSYRGGYHDFSIETGGIVCFPRLIAAEHRHVGARGIVHSGIAELDQLFGGGLDRGTTTLLLGPAGVGKSIIATQYAVAAAERDERSAIYLFDEGIETFCVRAAGLNADVRPHVENGRIRIEQIDPAELSPGEFAHRVRQAVDVDGARLVIIDSLNGYLNAMPEERFLVAQLHELFTYVRQRNVLTISVVAQHGFVGGMETPVDVSYLADTVVLLRYFEAAGEVRQAISVMKKRSGVHERTIRELRLDAKGIRVGSPLVEVHGVLTGVPIYSGQEAPLLGKR